MSNTDTSQELAELIEGISAGRWRKYTKHFDVVLADLEKDQIAFLLIAASEKQYKDSGLDDFERIENMTLGELSDFVGFEADDKSV